MSDDRDERVGYRRPPRHTQFRKGQSGNPNGRPKKISSFKADLAAELQEKLVITENGRQKKITKQQAFIKTLTAAAIKRDIRAVNVLLACIKLFNAGAEEPVAEPVDIENLDILENYIARQKKSAKRSRE